jgi:NADH dehydrogenase FAD-containing subunit
LKGFHVDIVEQMPDVATGLNKRRRFFLLERLKKNNVGFILRATIVKVDLPKVTLDIENDRNIRGDYDAVVYALGRQPNTGLKEGIVERFPPLRLLTIGDAQCPHTALEAIRQAALISAEI